MLPLDRLWQEQNRTPVLIASTIVVLVVAAVDWWVKTYIALGFLYLFPIMLAAAFLPRWSVALLGAGSAVLAELLGSPEPSIVRVGFAALALVGSGLFVGEMARNRRLNQRSEARLRVLVETSPAAIITVDERGFIELANGAAVDLIAPRQGNLIGDPIAAYLPDLHRALRWEEAPQFRASMQCVGHQGNGENFTADVWFSTYKDGLVAKLAAIITQVTEEDEARVSRSTQNGLSAATPESFDQAVLTPRETEVLRLLVQGLANKEIATRMEISESSVKNAIQQLFARTGVRTRSQLVRAALEQYRSIL